MAREEMCLFLLKPATPTFRFRERERKREEREREVISTQQAPTVRNNQKNKNN